MPDFKQLRRKAEDFAEKNAPKVDSSIDKAAGKLSGRFGKHSDKIGKAAGKLKDALPGDGTPGAKPTPGDPNPR